ncbi:MAG TPA: SAM-dependent methyltransferase [Polyangiaceae bacterium]|nr:SAM-dependent methyltransferase [Polyangiaceae bacterium]
MTLVLAAADSKDALRRELTQTYGKPAREVRAGVFDCGFELSAIAPAPYLVFARQILPEPHDVSASSIRAWAGVLVEAIAGVLPDSEPWSLHVYPVKEVLEQTRVGARAWHSQTRGGRHGDASREALDARPGARAESAVGSHRCRLIQEAVLELLQKRRRHLLRSLRRDSGLFLENEALVQLALTAPDAGFLSIAAAPLPHTQRRVLSNFAGGELPLAVDKQAPSRAFAKLVEAELRMGRRIAAHDSCVDLGAAPGSWTYVALKRGARVTSVDRAELRADLMAHRNVEFQQGDAFKFEPAAPADWLLCDVIASAERSAELLVKWLRERWCLHFVVTLKVDDAGSSPVLARLKQELPALTSELWLQRLCANKKEVCAFGTIAD